MRISQSEAVRLCPYCFTPLNGNFSCPKCGTGTTGRHFTNALPVGVILCGRYVVGKVLGKGGFGITYLCYDQHDKCVVAVKEYCPDGYVYRPHDSATFLLNDSANEEAFVSGAQRFFDEAKTVSRFNGNPNIIGVRQFFYENNTVYYVMEYLDGCDMKNYADRCGGRIPETEAAFVLNKVCEALLVVHSTGIFHRDISPDNIYLCNDGNIKLIDFGAARQVFGQQTQSLSVIFKKGFAPMEQRQTHGKQGPWTDIYALGATVYYLITGKVPSDAIDRMDEPELDMTGISPAFAAIIGHMMEMKSADRYQDVLSLINDVRSLPQQAPCVIPPFVGTPAGAQIPGSGQRTNPAFTGGTPAGAQIPGPGQRTNPVFTGGTPAGVQIPGTGQNRNPVFTGGTPAGAQIPGSGQNTNPAFTGGTPAGAQIPGSGQRINPAFAGGTPAGVQIPASGQNRNPVFVGGTASQTYTGNSGAGAQSAPKSKKKKILLIVIAAAVVTVMIPTIVGITVFNANKGEQGRGQIEATATPRRGATTAPTTPKPATKPIASGTCGYNLTWTLDNSGELTVSGKGSIENYDPYSKAPWYSYYKQIKTVEIGQGVENIGDWAFDGCTSLTSITISNSVTSIGCGAFCGCESLTDITIPNSVTSIGKEAFFYCESLTGITIPNNVTSIGDYVFCGCESLASITIPNSVTSIGDFAFYSCTSLTSITIPNSVTSIGNYAFEFCTSLKSITIPNSVTSIGESAFNYCTSLKSITIPNSVTSIGKEAFRNCPSGCVIYCAAASKPAGWDNNWNSGFDGTVEWGVTK